jgi:hypothetical protein
MSYMSFCLIVNDIMHAYLLIDSEFFAHISFLMNGPGLGVSTALTWASGCENWWLIFVWQSHLLCSEWQTDTRQYLCLMLS